MPNPSQKIGNISTDAVERAIFEQKKRDFNGMATTAPEAPVHEDFSRMAEEILRDSQSRGVVARAVGRDLSEKDYISERDLQTLVMLTEINTDFRKQVEMKILPIQKRGRDWAHPESVNLRREYMKKADAIFDIISRMESKDLVQREEIFLDGSALFDKASSYLEFASAAALVDKAARKKKTTKIGCSAYFRESYIAGKRAAVFGLFEGFDGRGNEHVSSSIPARMLKESAPGFATEQNMLRVIENFMRESDAKVSESVVGFCGASGACGAVVGKTLYYANIGNIRLYGVRPDGGIDLLSGEPLPSASLGADKALNELKYPYIYLGGFTQRVKGRQSFKIIHTEFSLRPPHIGTVDMSGHIGLLASSSGVWKGALDFSSGISDGMGAFGETFARAKNPVSALERVSMQMKSKMKDAGNRAVSGDIGMVYFML
jgi:hypothetical protein